MRCWGDLGRQWRGLPTRCAGSAEAGRIRWKAKTSMEARYGASMLMSVGTGGTDYTKNDQQC